MCSIRSCLQLLSHTVFPRLKTWFCSTITQNNFFIFIRSSWVTMWFSFMHLLLAKFDHCYSLIVDVPSGVLGSWIGFCDQLLVNLPLSLDTRVMCCIGCLCPSGYYTTLPFWFRTIFLDVLHLTCVILATQCLVLEHIGCFALQ